MKNSKMKNAVLSIAMLLGAVTCLSGCQNNNSTSTSKPSTSISTGTSTSKPSTSTPTSTKVDVASISAELANNDKYICSSYIFLARAISALNQMNTSIEYYQKAILLAEKIKDNYLCSGAMNELAGIYTNIKDYQSALKYAQKALQINETDEIESLGQNFLGLGEIYYYLAIPDSAYYYFNKALYPIVNEFERKLRKLLYLASSLHGDENSQKVIVGLEEQELGNIFETLFSDAAFVKKAKETINKTLSWQFTRAELLDAINKLDENRLWTLLLGDDCVETLCSSFSEIRNYRNDVMHAHNIDYEQFNKAHKLFKKVNTELDSAIGKLIGAKETNTEVTSTDFNNTLSSALAALHSPIDTSGLLVVSEALKSITSNQPIISPEVSKTLSQIGRFATGECTLKPEVIAAIANLGKIAALQSEIAPATRAMSEIAKQLASYKIDIPPAVTELQQRLSEIDFSMLPNSNNTQQEDEEKNPNEPHEI